MSNFESIKRERQSNSSAADHARHRGQAEHVVQEGAAQDLRAGQLPHGERAAGVQPEEHRVDGAEADRTVRPAAAAALPPHHQAHAAPHLQGGLQEGAQGGVPPGAQPAQDGPQAHHAQVVHAQEARALVGLQGTQQLPAAAARAAWAAGAAALAAVRAGGAAAAIASEAGAVAPSRSPSHRSDFPTRAAVLGALEEAHSGLYNDHFPL